MRFNILCSHYCLFICTCIVALRHTDLVLYLFFNLHCLHLLPINSVSFAVIYPIRGGCLYKHFGRKRHGSLQSAIMCIDDRICQLFDFSYDQYFKRSIQDRLAASNFQNGAKTISILPTEQFYHINSHVVLMIFQKAAID